MEFVFDRTWADVVHGNEKGCYGASDLNRVETAVEQLQALAKKIDVALSLQTKTDWAFSNEFSRDTWPTKPQMDRYLENVRQVCGSCGVQAQLPESMWLLDWEGANQIEEALYLTWQRIENILQTYRYSGEVFSGEENIV